MSIPSVRFISFCAVLLVSGWAVCLPGFEDIGSGCEPCRPGFYKGVTDKSCVACSPGTYNQYYGATTCSSCEGNRIASDSGSTSCTPCYGRTVADTSHVVCEPCLAGYGFDVDRCSPCPQNTFGVDGRCYNCSVGMVSDVGSASCEYCDSSEYYSDELGVGHCLPCPGNQQAVEGAVGIEYCFECNPFQTVTLSGCEANIPIIIVAGILTGLLIVAVILVIVHRHRKSSNGESNDDDTEASDTLTKSSKEKSNGISTESLIGSSVLYPTAPEKANAPIYYPEVDP